MWPIVNFIYRFRCFRTQKIENWKQENDIYFKALKIYHNELDIIKLLKEARLGNKFR
jgi:hypothetical protein